MDNKLKAAVDSLKLSDAAAERITRSLEQAPSRPRRRFRARAVIAIAAAAALLTLSVSAAYVELFRNSEIVGGVEDIPEPSIRPGMTESSVSYTRPLPDYGAPLSLDEGAENYREMYALFGTDEMLGGRVLSEPWTGSRVLCGSGDVLEREVYNASGYVKRDLFPARIELAADELAPFLDIDFSALARLARPAEEANLICIKTDPDGALYEASLTAHYSAGEDGEWFRLGMCHLAQHEWADSSYVFEDDWDEAYYYTNASGLEFLITVLDSRIDAWCVTEHTSLSLMSYFMSTEELEAVLDCLSLPQ